MRFDVKGGVLQNGSTRWLPYLPFQAIELINSVTDNPHRSEWVLRVDGKEKSLQEWFNDGVEVDGNTFEDMLAEEGSNPSSTTN